MDEKALIESENHKQVDESNKEIEKQHIIPEEINKMSSSTAPQTDGDNSETVEEESPEQVRENREDFLKRLATAYYMASPRLQEEFTLNEAINKVMERFLDSDEKLEDIEDILLLIIAEREKSRRNDMKPSVVSNNHKSLFAKLKELFELLNRAGIDYQLGGDLGSFVQYGEESNFAHYNISISINESDIEKLVQICGQLGLNFNDNRLTSKRVLRDGDPTNGLDILASDLKDNIQIGFMPFERKENGTVSEKDYYQDEAGNHMVQETVYSNPLAQMAYGNKQVDFKGTQIKVEPSEFTYFKMQGSHNWKDAATKEFLASNVDKEKLSQMENAMSQRMVYNHPATSSLDDLKQMMKGEPQKMETGPSLEPPKQLIKHNGDSNAESGFISNAIITTLALITFVLCFIGIAIIYLVK